MSALDERVNQAVLHVRYMERLIHDPGPWELRIGALRIPCIVERNDESVSLWTEIPANSGLSGAVTMEVLCAGEVVRVAEMTAPPEEGCYVEWQAALSPCPA